MGTSMSDSPAFISTSSGLSDRGESELGFITTGGIRAERLIDDVATARDVRAATVAAAADALSMIAQRQASDGKTHAKSKIKAAIDATLITVETGRAAVLFADMRGYMGLAEQVPPARVVILLDELFTVLARVCVSFGGQVFHIAGDGMMAGFGVRDSRRSGAREALVAGLAMLESLAPITTRWREELGVVTGIGIGLHLGEVALGFLGPPGKKAITLIGDTANVAARLCSRARAGELLYSCAIAAELVDDRDGPVAGPKPFLQLPQFELRGRSKLLDVWCVPAPEGVAH